MKSYVLKLVKKLFVLLVLEGMSELDDKVAHLRQDMSLYRRQLENKRGDDEVSVWWLLMRAKCASTSVLTIREWTILISYSQYWTGSSLQLRLMRGVFSNANEIYFFLMIFLRTSLHCKLVVPVPIPRMQIWPT